MNVDLSVQYSNIAGILNNPSNYVPSLSDSEKYDIIITSIKAYVHSEMNFQIFLDIVTKMKLFSGLTDHADYVNDALIKLVNLSSYVENEESKKEYINTTLVNVLDGLLNKH